MKDASHPEQHSLPKTISTPLPKATTFGFPRVKYLSIVVHTCSPSTPFSPQHCRRYAASFSKTQEPNWRTNGDPALGPGTYAVERAEGLTFPAPLGGAGDADPSRPSLPFRVRFTPFDTQHLAAGYKTLKPRFSTPRSALYASELSGRSPGAAADPADAGVAATTTAERTAGVLIDSKKNGGRRRPSPAAKASVYPT